MTKKLFKKSIALFIIYLIINLVTYSSVVYGVGITVKSAKGSDGYEKLIRANDSITVEVEASVTGDNEILPAQIKFIDPSTPASGTNFQSCSLLNANVYSCSYQGSQFNLANHIGQTIITSVALFSDTNALFDSENIVFTKDTAKPLSSLKVSQQKAGNKSVLIQYEAKDPTTQRSGCSGIKKIEFSLNSQNSTFESVELNGSCLEKSSIAKELSSFNEGQNTLSMRAFDKFDFVSDPASATFSVDQTPVTIDIASFKLLVGGAATTYVGPAGAAGAVVSIDIIGNDLDKNSVIANLSGLHVSRNYKNMKGTCGNTIDEKTTCTWTIDVLLQNMSKDIDFRASDVLGNENYVSFNPAISIDAEKPTLANLESDFAVNKTIYLRAANNTIKANIAEALSGIDKNQVFLDLSQIGLGNSVKATECNLGWTCFWRNVDAKTSGRASIMLNPKSSDRAGNLFNPAAPISVIVDNKAPIINQVYIRPIGGILPAYEGYIKTFDSLEITINLTEETQISNAIADFSKFISGSNNSLASNCLNNKDNTWTCKWLTQPIDMTGYIKNKITFKITDAVGNVLVHDVSLEVFDLSNGTANFFEHTIQCSPSKIDRQVTQLINQRIYCHISLTSQNAVPVKTELKECKGEIIKAGTQDGVQEIDSRGFFQNIELFNNNVASKDPYLRLTLQTLPAKIDSLPLTCSLSIAAKVDNQILRVPEIENVSVEVEFYNMPLGELSDVVNEKIEKERDKAFNKLYQTIGKLNKLFEVAKKICNFYYGLVQVWFALKKIGIILSGAEVVTPPPYDEPVTEIRSETQTLGADKFSTTVKGMKARIEAFCKFTNCRLYYDTTWSSGGTKKKDPTKPKPDDGKEKKGFFSKFKGDGTRGITLGEWQRKVNNELFALGGTNKIPGIKRFDDERIMAIMKPDQSFIMSALTLCVPGMVYNLNKYRNIQCQYVGCLENAAQRNLPLNQCDEIKSYSTCKYFLGEIFHLVGIVNLFDHVMGYIKSALSDPLGLLDVSLYTLCDKYVPNHKQKGFGFAYAACQLEDMLSLVGDVVSDIENTIDSSKDWKVAKDYCDEIKPKKDKEEKQEQKSTTSGGSNKPSHPV